jgi:hypothetical protein
MAIRSGHLLAVRVRIWPTFIGPLFKERYKKLLDPSRRTELKNELKNHLIFSREMSIIEDKQIPTCQKEVILR